MIEGANRTWRSRIKLVELVIYIVGGCFTMAAVVRSGLGGRDTGWTFLHTFISSSSYSNLRHYGPPAVLGPSSRRFTGLNSLSPSTKMRAPEMNLEDAAAVC